MDYVQVKQLKTMVQPQRHTEQVKCWFQVSGDTGAGSLVSLYCVKHTLVSELYCLAVPCHSERRPSRVKIHLYLPDLEPS